MPRVSAGILPYRLRSGRLEVLLVHPGGPFWARKDAGAWSIAKGEIDPDEDPLAAAIREFEEETGHAPSGDFLRLTSVRQPGGKLVHAWAVELEWDPSNLASNDFEMEWPRGSGRTRRFPEVDRAEWFDDDEALRRVLAGQRRFIEELRARIRASAAGEY
jgi:predicted NUDIX family NTP pyrophosphohydrolase